MRTVHILFACAIFFLSLFQACRPTSRNNEVFINLTFADSLYAENVSGKLIFLLSSDTSQALIYGVDARQPHPVYTIDINNHNPQTPVVIRNFSARWFQSFSQLNGEYAVRVIFDCDTLLRSSFVTKGNGYSKKQIVKLQAGTSDTLMINIDNKFRGWEFNPVRNVSEIKYKSEKLSAFWGKEIYIEAAVILPDSYHNDSLRRYPLVFVFPGFGSHHAAVTYGDGQIARYGMNRVGEEKIFVFCNAEFRQGYHHFTNSENNGPWADAFVQEFVLYIENEYRTNGVWLMGQSSGAWTAAWLQVNYPDLFRGTFAASPDPVDFRAMAHNIYTPGANFYFAVNADSAQICKGKTDSLGILLEEITGEFGQVRSWEATFSPRGSHGLPAPLFDRKTGDIDPKVVEHWAHFDISRKLDSNPEYFREKLKNKISFFVSNDDPYGLDQSLRLLEKVCKKNKIDLSIEYLNGLGHDVWTDAVREKIHSLIDSYPKETD